MLQEVEAEALHNLSFQLHSSARVQNSINWKKSIMNCLQEGDGNTNFFHGVMSNRRRQNTINMVFVNGVDVEGVQNIRAAVFNHFSSHFKRVATVRPSVEALPFRRLSRGEAGNSIKLFSLEEVKQVV